MSIITENEKDRAPNEPSYRNRYSKRTETKS